MIKNFTYTRPDSLADVASELSGSGAEIIAGGTDIVGVINEKIKDVCPEKLVSLKNLGLNYIKEENGELHIGAMTTLGDIERSDIIREKYGVLGEAAHSVASPQIRHMATIGGNLCQEPRCWYYRYQNNRFNCMRKGGQLCNAMMGNNVYHSVFGGAKVCGSPCEAQCPNGTSIPEYFDMLRRGDIDGAAALLWEMNPLAAVVGRVCPHTCQSACNRAEYGEPVSIRSVERTVGDYMLENAERLIKKSDTATGKSVAVIGAGPAGLTAAYFLAKQGHDVTVYDANEKAGGMLRYGIPAYRLPREVIDRIADILEGMGVRFVYGYVLGRDGTIEGLQKENDVVFAAIGAWGHTDMRCPGEDADGVEVGIDFLKRAAEYACENGGGEMPDVKDKVIAVVGGGNTAMDCCRTAKRLGADRVYVFYRRTEAEMPADEEERTEAIREGVEFRYLTAPTEISERAGGGLTVRLQRMELGEPDESGRRRPMPIEGAYEDAEADMLISAIGQKTDVGNTGLKMSGGVLSADSATHMTGTDGVFVSGDAAIGPKTVIEAVADARKTADSVNRYLGGGSILREKELYGELFFDESCMEEGSEGLSQDIADVENRTYLDEDVKSASVDEIRAEANRCFNCGCVAVSPSDTAPALITLNADMITSKRTIPAAEFFRAGTDVSTVLEDDEILIEIRIREADAGSAQRYAKFRTRKTIDFPIFGLASNINVEDGVITGAKLAAGGAAPVPYEFYEVEKLLTGRKPSAELAAEAADLSVRHAVPLKENGFKVQIIRAYVRRAVAGLIEER